MAEYPLDKVKDWKNKKVAVYIRASQGDAEKVGKQWDIVRPWIEFMRSKRKIGAFDYHIRGKSFVKAGGWRGVDVDRRGDIWNEGIQSGFQLQNRPVLEALFDELNKGRYQAVIVYDFERIARNYDDLAYITYEPRYNDDAAFYDILNDLLLTKDTEFLPRLGIILGIEVGGEKKRGEIEKGIETVDLKLATGFVAGGLFDLGQAWKDKAGRRPAFPWRRLWHRFLSEGESRASTPEIPKAANVTNIALDFGKSSIDKKTGELKGNAKWAQKWFKRMSWMNQMGVLDDWLDVVEQVSERAVKARGRVQNEKVWNLLEYLTGWLNHPAGLWYERKVPKSVPPKFDDVGFVKFPHPLEIGLDALMETADPRTLKGWEVTVSEDKLADQTDYINPILRAAQFRP